MSTIQKLIGFARQVFKTSGAAGTETLLPMKKVFQGAGAQRLCVSRETIVHPNGMKVKQDKVFMTPAKVDNVLFEQLGCKAGIIMTELATSKWSIKSLDRLFEGTDVKLFWKDGFHRGHLTEAGYNGNGEELYFLRIGPNTPQAVLDRLTHQALALVGLTPNHLLPVHKAMKVDRLGNMMLYVDINGTTVMDPAIRYRAGSDLFGKEAFAQRKVKVLVVDTPKNVNDGNSFFVRKGEEWNNSLGKMFFVWEKGKQEVAKSDFLEDVNGLVPDGYDILMPLHNLKWKSGIKGGDSFEAVLYWTKRQDHTSDLGVQEYKVPVGVLQTGAVKWNPGWRKRLGNMYQTQVRKELSRNHHKTVEDVVTNILSGKFDDDLMGYVAGSFGDVTGIHETASQYGDGLAERLGSILLPGLRRSIIADGSAERGTLLVHPLDYITLQARGIAKGGKVTVVRFPDNNYQSFMTLKIVQDSHVLLGGAILNHEDIEYLQGDGDDHVLITWPFSAFEPGEPVISARGEQLDVTKVSPVTMYWMSWLAAEMLGPIANGIRKARAAGDWALARDLGAFLDVIAQAIKKPYELSEKFAQLMKRVKALKIEGAKKHLLALAIKDEADGSCVYHASQLFDLKVNSKEWEKEDPRKLLAGMTLSEKQAQMAWDMFTKIRSTTHGAKALVIKANDWLRASHDSEKVSDQTLVDRTVAYSAFALMLAIKGYSIKDSVLKWAIPLGWGMAQPVEEDYTDKCTSYCSSIVPVPTRAIEIQPLDPKDWWGSMKATNTADMLLAAIGVKDDPYCEPQLFEVRVCEPLPQ